MVPGLASSKVPPFMRWQAQRDFSLPPTRPLQSRLYWHSHPKYQSGVAGGPFLPRCRALWTAETDSVSLPLLGALAVKAGFKVIEPHPAGESGNSSESAPALENLPVSRGALDDA